MSPKTDLALVRREDQEEVLARFETLSGNALKASMTEESRAKALQGGMRAVGEPLEEEESGEGGTREERARLRALNKFSYLQGQPATAQDMAAGIEEGNQRIGLVSSGSVGISDEQDPARELLRQHAFTAVPEVARARANLQLSEIRAEGPLAAAAAQIGDLTRDSIRSIGDTVALTAIGAAFDGITELAGRATQGTATALGASEDVAAIAKDVAEFAIRKGVKPVLLASVASALAA